MRKNKFKAEKNVGSDGHEVQHMLNEHNLTVCRSMFNLPLMVRQ
jgi:hypothetical protein